MKYSDDPDGFNQHQMAVAFEDGGWAAAQEVAWAELRDRLMDWQEHAAYALILAWCTRDPKHIKQVEAGVRRWKKEQAA